MNEKAKKLFNPLAEIKAIKSNFLFNKYANKIENNEELQYLINTNVWDYLNSLTSNTKLILTLIGCFGNLTHDPRRLPLILALNLFN